MTTFEQKTNPKELPWLSQHLPLPKQGSHPVPIAAESAAVIAAICRRHQVAALDLFRHEPDYYDFLVDFLPQASLPWGAEYDNIRQDLEAALKAKVGLVPPHCYDRDENPWVRGQIAIGRHNLYHHA